MTLIPTLTPEQARGLYFQQDGARCHVAEETLVLLRNNFADVIGDREGTWPPRSCDLTCLDYWYA